MSLQLIAKQMEAKGRDGDSVLVHMTHGEVAGLQKLAESAGGSLSVNPETGLVEANFLKRMLPTLVGIGVGAATMNPYAGAAAGAAVGGVQAKQNDQSVGMGMLMGGLGGYGGAGIGSGLSAAGSQAAQAGAMQTAANTAATNTATAANTANAANVGTATAMPSGFVGASAGDAAGELTAQQALLQQAANETLRQEASARAIEQAAQTEAERFAAQGVGAKTSQGLSALADQGSNVGRDAFMSKVGISDASMAAAPMMAPGEAPGPTPVDDEMYAYTFDPGRTGAERTPTSSSAEREYFRSSYSPVRKTRASNYPVYAAQGGLMGLAEGGSTAAPSQGMTGGSAAAFDYLMGAAPSSAGLPSMAMQAPATQAPMADSGRAYVFNPTAGTFARNPNFVDPEVAAQAARDAAAAERAAAELERQMNSGGGNAAGGLLGLAKGGMASGGFVVPADVVSALGNGSTDAGLRKLHAMLGKVNPIKGKGDGLSDSIKTNIDGKQPARVADGEAYIDPKTVKRLGGAKKLYAMMDKIRAQAHGKTSQQRKVNPAKVMA